MILKKWSEAWKIYKACGRQLSTMALFLGKQRWSYWYVWVTSIGVYLSTVPLSVSVLTQNIMVGAFGYGLFLSLLLLHRSLYVKTLAKRFPGDYATHGIADSSYWERPMYMHYALFLRELEEQDYSTEDVTNLLKFAEIATPPEAPAFQLSQHRSFMFLLGAFTSVFISTLINAPWWKSGAALFITMGLQLLWTVGMLLVLWHGVATLPKYQHQEIQRFLQWAERDIPEKKLIPGTDLIC